MSMKKGSRFVISEAKYIKDENAVLESSIIGFDTFKVAKEAFIKLANAGRAVYLWTRYTGVEHPVLAESKAYLDEHQKVKD